MGMVNSNTDARNGTNVNDPGPTTQLKTHHPNATAAATPPTHPTKPAIVERRLTDARMSAKAIGPPTPIAPNLDAKKDKGSTKTYANRVRIFPYFFFLKFISPFTQNVKHKNSLDKIERTFYYNKGEIKYHPETIFLDIWEYVH
jgi:hypothetical protein